MRTKVRQPATSELNSRKFLSAFFKQIFLWGPIVVGLVHQFLMAFFGIECIYVFVDPPGKVCPFVSLEYQWWLVLLLGTAIVSILAYLERIKSIPRRFALPTYLYILLLLILVKPV